MLFKFVSAVLLLASSIHGLVLLSPPSGSTLVSGTNVVLYVTVSAGGVDAGVTAATITFTGQNGSTATTSIPDTSFSVPIVFNLPSTFSAGITTITAAPVGGSGSAVTDVNTVTVVAPYAPVAPVIPFPCYNNFCNPCPKPVCNVRRSRCSTRKLY